jgi:glycerol-3-phosphate acyltransferase PlsX
MNDSKRIVLDAMGGDTGPRTVVEAMNLLEPELRSRVLLVGIEDEIKACEPDPDWGILHAGEVIGMNETPSQALRKKKNSSIAVGINHVKSGEAAAFVSAGNTGAVMAFAVNTLGRLSGVLRPAIAGTFPTSHHHKPCLVVDVGANVDCKPEQLRQFAVMGQTYYREVIGEEKPRVGLLSIGAEEEKGNELIHGTRELLKQAPINFIGHVEGRDIFNGSVDVVVCDGFVGNVILKASEGVATLLMEWIYHEVQNTAQKSGDNTLEQTFARLLKRVDYSETGGAPLLGVNGVCLISHGSSTAKAIANAVRTADQTIQHDVNEHITAEIGALSVAS